MQMGGPLFNMCGHIPSLRELHLIALIGCLGVSERVTVVELSLGLLSGTEPKSV